MSEPTAPTTGLVLLPGLGGHAGEFDAQAEQFGRQRRVLALDPFSAGDLSVDGQADQLAELVRRRGLAGVVVLGHSHGGIVALATAARHPDLVAGLVVLDSPLLLPRAVRALARVPLSVLRTRLAARVLRGFFAATFTESDPAAWRTEVLRRLDLVPRQVASAVVHGTFTYDTARAIDALEVPVLVVRANVPLRTRRLPGHVQVGDATGAGHWPHVHAPEVVNDLIAEFLSAPRPVRPGSRSR
jgi:pimeloyl-ACP methyl ester carboxylesterase